MNKNAMLYRESLSVKHHMFPELVSVAANQESIVK